MSKSRDDLVYLAKLAEQAERFDEMARRGAEPSPKKIHRATNRGNRH